MFAAVLGIISNVTFGTANVFYYAYLPLLADAHPTVRKLKSEIERELYQIDISSQQNTTCTSCNSKILLPTQPSSVRLLNWTWRARKPSSDCT
jgi:DNA-directed RNA polymerase subunit RPC12/RpoP